MMRVGRIPYVNCYPVYGGIDRGIVPLSAEIVPGVPTELNAYMAEMLESGRIAVTEASRALADPEHGRQEDVHVAAELDHAASEDRRPRVASGGAHAPRIS